ncbi:hypothetical protein Asppvi_002041 [Aspergillus pseudoviridinutans]|uniref:Uncharacterized protein n=1 Tax=Aspergillus pseudoviridinutans TaxID=1517512 RepID=A0A9P3BQQ1_9EURO|nr:uncharacterized protein Asppvi_002041 [Aspergillus pseudoviridinutans]GIJ92763.1 hypothetical protein Asppvi_002041 [Aspergillus pseudoviridinutans]
MPRKKKEPCVDLVPAELLTQLSSAGLPFPAQHRILVVLQRRLERSVFEFIRTWHPRLSKSKRWDCAEKVELHTAFRALERKLWALPNSEHRERRTNNGFSRLRPDIMGIRHAAVHRQPHAHGRLLQQLRSAHEFATVWLNDQQCGREIQQCQGRVGLLFEEWNGRTRRVTENLIARMDYHNGAHKGPIRNRYRYLLCEAARRLLDKINLDCIKQVDDMLHASFPPLDK